MVTCVDEEYRPLSFRQSKSLRVYVFLMKAKRPRKKSLGDWRYRNDREAFERQILSILKLGLHPHVTAGLHLTMLLREDAHI